MIIKKTFLIVATIIISSFHLLYGEGIENDASLPGRVLILKKTWQISDDEQNRFYLKYPYNLTIGQDGSIFIQDEHQLLKFTAAGKFIRNFVKRGEGPGEFQRFSKYFLYQDQIILFQSRPGKIIHFDKDGKLIKEFVFSLPGISRFVIYKSPNYYLRRYNYLATKKIKSGLHPITYQFLKMTAKGKIDPLPLKLNVLWNIRIMDGGGFSANFITRILLVQASDTTCYLNHTSEYLIKVVDLDTGNILKTFKRPYSRVKYQKIKLDPSKNPNSMPPPDLKYFNDIYQLHLVNQTLWVVTSTISKDKGILIDVFNLKGQYSDHFYLPLRLIKNPHDFTSLHMTAKDSKIYIIEKDEEENPVITAYTIHNL